jgi:3-deoxy-D-manno-octulosonic acid (KDO) 8-phosphate synthase
MKIKKGEALARCPMCRKLHKIKQEEADRENLMTEEGSNYFYDLLDCWYVKVCKRCAVV